jgi:hypothetical protein
VNAVLASTGTRVLYTLELGDSVERWWADSRRTLEQMTALDPMAGGRFLVWANHPVAQAAPVASPAPMPPRGT